jgi:porphobilinogen synthase
MHAENTLSAADLIWPIFVTEGHGVSEPVRTMPGVNRLSVDQLGKAAMEAVALGIPCIALFPYTQPDRRTEDGAEALNPDNLVCRAIKALKDAAPGLGVLTDVALDPYTSLEGEGFDLVQIMAYSAKYASAFYGPFRDAVGSSGYLKGDKKTYQMDSANSREAIREVELDIAEGADSVMIKPGMPYLDIIRMVRDRFDVPVFAYQVSGEYALIEAAVAAGVLDRDRAVLETLLGFKRAGCSGILTYFAPLAAKLLAG